MSEITASTNTAYQCTITIRLCKKNGPSNAHVVSFDLAPLAKRYPKRNPIRASSETHTKKTASPQHRCGPPPVPTIVEIFTMTGMQRVCHVTPTTTSAWK